MMRAPRPRLTFLLTGLLAASAAPALADTATPAAACAAPSDALTDQDRQVLAAAEQLAQEASGAIEQWITAQVLAEDQVFARLYFPVAKTSPRRFTTVYEQLVDRDLMGPGDKALAASPQYVYAFVTDVGAYAPVHNSKFSRPLTGDAEKDHAGNRAKRIMLDPVSVAAARSSARYLLQKSQDGGAKIYDLSVPIMVRGKHWGTARIGYKRSE